MNCDHVTWSQPFCILPFLSPWLIKLPILPDPKLQTAPLDDAAVALDVPRIAVEEMLQQMTLEDHVGTQGSILPGDQQEGTVLTH